MYLSFSVPLFFEHFDGHLFLCSLIDTSDDYSEASFTYHADNLVGIVVAVQNFPRIDWWETTEQVRIRSNVTV